MISDQIAVTGAQKNVNQFCAGFPLASPEETACNNAKTAFDIAKDKGMNIDVA